MVTETASITWVAGDADGGNLLVEDIVARRLVNLRRREELVCWFVTQSNTCWGGRYALPTASRGE